MRLLNVKTLTITEFLEDKTRPRYAIASHRWGKEEVAFEDVQEGRKKSSAGYQKVEAFAQYVRDNIKSVCWLWIDTCCINKKDAVELSYAINSMFRWYRNSDLCIAQLASIAAGTLPSDIGQDEWFRRGWTLQELLAPRLVVFLTKDWRVIGSKGSSLYHNEDTFVGPDLGAEISSITRIPKRILDDWEASIDVLARDKMLWMEGRTTSREEDIVYALFGVIGVTLSIIYGEGESNAKQRLLAELHRRKEIESQHKNRYKKITKWLRPSDPWTNHESARKLHEQQTGEWLLHTNEYQSWKAGLDRYLWLYGGPGCGKTVLCSTTIEDMKTYCEGKSNVGHAVFYFSFSDERKQSYEDLLLSLVAQLGRNEPALSMLQQLYEKSNGKAPGHGELEKILLAALASYERVFCHLDALDESPEEDGVRQRTMDSIEELLKQAPSMRLIVTSRDELGIHHFTDRLNAKAVCLTSKVVDPDIQRYVSKQLSRIPKLARLDTATKELVERTLTTKADGMFRWVFCQLQELTKSKRTDRRTMEAALIALPETLDKTYERMLRNIATIDQPYALKLLRWLTYAQRPLSLDELAEASIIEPSENLLADDIVDVDSRGGLEDALDILTGLVVTIEASDENAADEKHLLDDVKKTDNETHVFPLLQIKKDTKVRLAHFSVKEYLESERIKQVAGKSFQLCPSREHWRITQSCLVYFMHYSDSLLKTSKRRDLDTFPLLEYAAAMWYNHALLQHSGDNDREMHLLMTDRYRRDWLSVHEPESSWKESFATYHGYDSTGNPMYYASLVGLVDIVQQLLGAKAEVNAQGGRYGNALQAASSRGHKKVVQMLLYAGADVNAQGGEYGNALQAASSAGFQMIVRMLIDHGADINAQGGRHSDALLAAVHGDHVEIVRLLLSSGAKLITDNNNMTALHYVGFTGNIDIAHAILQAGFSIDFPIHRRIWVSRMEYGRRVWESEADPHLPGPDADRTSKQGLTPLHHAVLVGSLTMTKFFLENGADPNARSDYGETPLLVAIKQDLFGPKGNLNGDRWVDSSYRIEDTLDMMIGLVDDIEYEDIQAQISSMRREIVQVLLSHEKIDINCKCYQGRSPLHCIPYQDSGSTVLLKTLLAKGTTVDAPDSEGQTALHVACLQRNSEAVQLLIKYGANIQATDRNGRHALHYAAQGADTATLETIFEAARQVGGASVNPKDTRGWNALHHLVAGEIALRFVDIEAVCCLTRNDVPVNELNNDGEPPIAMYLKRFLDRSSHKAQIVDHLFKHGADPSYRTRDGGQNLGHLTAACADEIGIELLRTLQCHGVDLKAEDNTGQSILHHCAQKGSLECEYARNFLFDVIGLSRHAPDETGSSPVAIANARRLESPCQYQFRPDRWHHTATLLSS